jgi:diguanylate cyclase (GGDEF)-like protein
MTNIIIYFISVILILFTGYIDFLTGPEIGFSIFYLIPIMISAWYLTCRTEIILTIPIISAFVWLEADINAGHIYSNKFIPIWNMSIRLLIFIIITVLLHKLRLLIHKEKEYARIDTLTGLYNTRYFSEIANEELSRLKRYNEIFSFAYIDIDNFKYINDHYGHTKGDLLLKEIAGILKESIREIDHVVRLGGDEFGILFPRTDEKQVKHIIERMNRLFINKVSVSKQISLSIGVTTFLKSPEDANTMVTVTDALMYKVKNSGKNSVSYEMFQ